MERSGRSTFVLATLLMAGPLAMGFLLFETTRGIFLGWLRAAVGLALTPLFVLVDNGREIGRIRGYPGEDNFWGLLGALIKKLNAGGTG